VKPALAKFTKVFWFFFSKKNCFLACFEKGVDASLRWHDDFGLGAQKFG
jgi:hypothetical protein